MVILLKKGMKIFKIITNIGKVLKDSYICQRFI